MSPVQPILSENKSEGVEKDAKRPQIRVKLLKDTDVPAWHAKVV